MPPLTPPSLEDLPPRLPGGMAFLRAYGNTPEDVSRNDAYWQSDAGLDRISRGMDRPDLSRWILRKFAAPQEFMTHPSGRPTAERLGVDIGMGGRPREEDRTFMSSDELIRETLRTLPPSFGRYANEHIQRPSVHTVYGEPSNLGGYASDPIAVGRGIEQGSSGVFPLGDRSTAISTARHELLHKQHQTLGVYSEDADLGFPDFMELVRANIPSLASAPSLTRAWADVRQFLAPPDPAHVWTALAESALRGDPLPPALSTYFAPILRDQASTKTP